MAELSTKYLGLTLKNPVIIGSSGLTNSVEDIKKLESNGAAAVVLKSLFEEQIRLETDAKIREALADNFLYAQYSETIDYIDVHIKEKNLTDYLALIQKAKQDVLIPIIASINCLTSQEWTGFAKKIEEAGADALELNIFHAPTDLSMDKCKTEQIYLDIIQKVKSQVSIPVSVKISPYFTNLGGMIQSLSKEADGIVLFNRFFSPDIDIDSMEITTANTFSTPEELYNSLRWIAIMAGRVVCDLAASTGIHDGQAIVKQILAGAKATQITSVVYNRGPEVITQILSELDNWMTGKGFNYIDQFRGRMSRENVENPAVFERMQFMKYFSQIQ